MAKTELSVCLTSVTHVLNYNFLSLVSLYSFSFSFILFSSPLSLPYVFSLLLPTNFFFFFTLTRNVCTLSRSLECQCPYI